MEKNIQKIVSSYINIVLGAGFISGSELYFFFGKYRFIGTICFAFTCILFFLILYKQQFIIKENNISNYHDFSKLIFDKEILPLIELVSLSFLFITSSTMISAFSQTLFQSFSIPFLISEIIVFMLVVYFILKDSMLIIKLNIYLFPVMFIGILLIGSYLISTISVSVISNNTDSNLSILKCVVLGILYLSFNSLNSIPMICNLNSFIDSKNTIFFSSFISAIILFILGIFLLVPIVSLENINSPLPILSLIDKNIINYIYTFVLLLAIFSTLISSLLSFIKTLESKISLNFSKKNKRYKLLVIILSIMLSNLGFGVFVGTLYPLFGILGIIQIVYILKF